MLWPFWSIFSQFFCQVLALNKLFMKLHHPASNSPSPHKGEWYTRWDNSCILHLQPFCIMCVLFILLPSFFSFFSFIALCKIRWTSVNILLNWLLILIVGPIFLLTDYVLHHCLLQGHMFDIFFIMFISHVVRYLAKFYYFIVSWKHVPTSMYQFSIHA